MEGASGGAGPRRHATHSRRAPPPRCAGEEIGLLVLTLIAAALLLSACDGGKPVRQPCPAGKVCLELGNDAEPTSLDPHKISGAWEDRIVGDMMVGLTQDDPQGDPIPGMATSWETSPDGLVWTFHLRDAKWSDGVPVTADDFVFALRRLMDPKTAAEYASLMYIIKNGEAVNAGKLPLSALGVRAIDAHTLEITLVHPAPYLTQLTMHMTMYPVPRHVVEKWGDAWSQPGHYVSNGPYKLVSWKLGDHVQVVKNPLFWDAASVSASIRSTITPPPIRSRPSGGCGAASWTPTAPFAPSASPSCAGPVICRTMCGCTPTSARRISPSTPPT